MQTPETGATTRPPGIRLHRSARLAALVLAVQLAGCAPPGPLSVDDARVREPVPGQDKTAAYATLANHTDAPLRLVGARAQPVRAIEIHTNIRDGDIVRMRRLDYLDIAPGQTVRLEPGGHHFMLFGVTSVPERLPVELRFADGRTQTVEFRRIGIGER